MNHGSLFSGIGGFDLAAEWTGWNNVFHCEINPFGKQVLKYYWPNSISYDDIKTTDFSIHRGTIDVLTGGFPCQPYSAAGKRLGKEDERHLWPEMLRAIREISPCWVVGENVRGLTTWNGGMVFDEVQADLEAAGYEVLPFLLPASGVNAPHERYRIWFVAYSGLFGQEKRQFKSMGFEQLRKERFITNATSNRWERKREGVEIEKRLQQRPESTGQLAGRPEGLRIQRDVTNTMHNRSQRSLYTREDSAKRWENENGHIKECLRFDRGRIQFDNFPTQSPVFSRNDGISPELVGITFSKHRNESIKAYGNAIVPQVIHQIFKSIAEYENLYNENSYNQK